MSLKKPTVKDIVEVLETLSEQGFIDVGPQEGGYDFLPLYDFLVFIGIATKVSGVSAHNIFYWLRLLNSEGCGLFIKILKEAETARIAHGIEALNKEPFIEPGADIPPAGKPDTVASYIEDLKKIAKEETT